MQAARTPLRSRSRWLRFGRLDTVQTPVEVVPKIGDGPFHRNEAPGGEVAADAALDALADRLVLVEEVRQCVGGGNADGLRHPIMEQLVGGAVVEKSETADLIALMGVGRGRQKSTPVAVGP